LVKVNLLLILIRLKVTSKLGWDREQRKEEKLP
jgi:hypothetical protein